MLHYFAYGSNLHPVRLKERVPSIKLVGTVELAHHDLCLLYTSDAADDLVSV